VGRRRIALGMAKLNWLRHYHISERRSGETRIFMQYTRKTLSKELGIGIETLRYYEKLKLIPKPVRDRNNYRVYSEEYVSIINHILIAKKYGFSLNEIKTVFELAKKTEFDTEDIKLILGNKLRDVEKQIIELNDLKSILHKLINQY
jgi:MerR family mercuric resistance operon transcriptional regulator